MRPLLLTAGFLLFGCTTYVVRATRTVPAAIPLSGRVAVDTSGSQHAAEVQRALLEALRSVGIEPVGACVMSQPCAADSVVRAALAQAGGRRAVVDVEIWRGSQRLFDRSYEGRAATGPSARAGPLAVADALRRFATALKPVTTSIDVQLETGGPLDHGVTAAMGGAGDTARNAFLDLTQRRPDYAPGWYDLGVLREVLGDFPGALEAFRRAQAIEATPLRDAAVRRAASRLLLVPQSQLAVEGWPGQTLGRVIARASSGGLPAAGVMVRLAAGGLVGEVMTDTAGEASWQDVPAGDFVVSVSGPDGATAEARGTARAGEDTTVPLVLVPTGRLVVKVTARNGRLVDADVAVGDASAETDAAGVATFERLAAGPVRVHVNAKGFNPTDELVQVVAGASAELPVLLVPARDRRDATLAGVVRDARTGSPVRARLQVGPQRAVADKTGAFSLTLAAGRHAVSISAKRFLTQSRSLDIHEGERVILNVDLHPD